MKLYALSKLRLLKSTVDYELKASIRGCQWILPPSSLWLYGAAGIWMICLFSMATEHLAFPLLMKYDSLMVSNQMAGSLTQLAV